MYPSMGMNMTTPGNYQYGNMYMPGQNFGYNMGYDFGYQGGGAYMNPVKFFQNIFNLIEE